MHTHEVLTGCLDPLLFGMFVFILTCVRLHSFPLRPLIVLTAYLVPLISLYTCLNKKLFSIFTMMIRRNFTQEPGPDVINDVQDIIFVMLYRRMHDRAY